MRAAAGLLTEVTCLFQRGADKGVNISRFE
jgi:hypothetical protein